MKQQQFGTLIPVIALSGCVGHLIRSARGFRAFDASDREIGTYPSPDDGARVLLELAVAEAA
jgi:hypothetical protein